MFNKYFSLNVWPLASSRAKPKVSPNRLKVPVFPIAAHRSKNLGLTPAGHISGINYLVTLQEYIPSKETSHP